MWIVAFDLEVSASYERKKRLFYYYLSKLYGEVVKPISKSVYVVKDREKVERIFEKIGGIRAVWISYDFYEEKSY